MCRASAGRQFYAFRSSDTPIARPLCIGTSPPTLSTSNSARGRVHRFGGHAVRRNVAAAHRRKRTERSTRTCGRQPTTQHDGSGSSATWHRSRCIRTGMHRTPRNPGAAEPRLRPPRPVEAGLGAVQARLRPAPAGRHARLAHKRRPRRQPAQAGQYRPSTPDASRHGRDRRGTASPATLAIQRPRPDHVEVEATRERAAILVQCLICGALPQRPNLSLRNRRRGFRRLMSWSALLGRVALIPRRRR